MQLKIGEFHSESSLVLYHQEFRMIFLNVFLISQDIDEKRILWNCVKEKAVVVIGGDNLFGINKSKFLL